MMTPKLMAVCVSGGLDSVVLAHWLSRQKDVKLHALSFDYRQKHIQELQWAKHHCQDLGIPISLIPMPALPGSKLTDGTGGWVVPIRNLALLSVAANAAEYFKADEIAFGANKDDAINFPDCRPEFFDAVNLALLRSESRVRVVTPFIKYTKREIVTMGKEMHVNLNQTWSCYTGEANPCGQCLACRNRAEAGA